MQVVVVKKESLYKYPFPNQLISTYWIKENDEFYRENVQPIYGILVGYGITEQFTIKSSTYTKRNKKSNRKLFWF